MKELSIGAFAKKFNVGVETIRFYHRQGLLSVPGSEGAIRKYGFKQHCELLFIQKSKECGLSLKDIKALMMIYEKSIPQCDEIQRMIDSKIELITNEAENLELAKKKLRNLRKSCDGCTKEKCDIIMSLNISKQV